jgi:hypothetical protein
MSTVEIGAVREAAAESLPELAAGLAVVVLTILGLARVSQTFLVETVAVLFCMVPSPGRVEKLSDLNQLFVRVFAR